jgi:hypothetical protein
MTAPRFSEEGRRMKSLLLVSAMIIATTLPVAAETCSERLGLCNAKCIGAECKAHCRTNHATCMRTGTFPVIGPYGPWPGLEKR